MERISRRSFFKGAGATVAAGATPGCQHAGQQQGPTQRAPRLFFKAEEAEFVEAAVARLIPADEMGPGALEAGVSEYIDRQLAGAWGRGERLYRSGPWQPGTPGQGYQLPFTPAELFRTAIRAIVEDLRRNRRSFAQLTAEGQDRYLAALEHEARSLGGVPSNVFFHSLLELTIEGFFSDPVYGGNKDMVGWKLLGFPGAYANYYDFVDQHGIAFKRPPMSLGQDASGAIHVHPVPATPSSGR